MPGSNTLTFKLETYQGTKVRELRIRDTSGIECTTAAPPDWEAKIKVPQGAIEVGNVFPVEFEIDNSGGWAIEDAIVEVVYADTSLAIVGGDKYRTARIEESASGRFEFRALRQGSSEITLRAQTGTGAPPQLIATIIAVVGQPGNASGRAFPWVSVIAGPIGVVFVGLGIRRFARR